MLHIKAQFPADPNTTPRERSAHCSHTFSSIGNSFGEEAASCLADALMVSYLKSKVICGPDGVRLLILKLLFTWHSFRWQ